MKDNSATSFFYQSMENIPISTLSCDCYCFVFI